MINRTAIQQWSEHAPWIDNAQIEQDAGQNDHDHLAHVRQLHKTRRAPEPA